MFKFQNDKRIKMMTQCRECKGNRMGCDYCHRGIYYEFYEDGYDHAKKTPCYVEPA